MGPVSLCFPTEPLPALMDSHHIEDSEIDSSPELGGMEERILIKSQIGRQSVLWRCLLPCHPLPYRLSVQASKGELHHSYLSPEHQLQREYLFRYSAGPVEPGIDDL